MNLRNAYSVLYMLIHFSFWIFQVFEPFGAVELVQLPLDPETGHCKGFGFVQVSIVRSFCIKIAVLLKFKNDKASKIMAF